MAKKQVIKLTESDLHNIIKESVNSILKEVKKAHHKDGKLKLGGEKWIDAIEDKPDRYGNPMYKSKDPSVAKLGRKTKDGYRRFQSYDSFRKNYLDESVNNILSELDWKTYANAAKKRYEQYKDDTTNSKAWDSAYELNKMANQRFDDNYVGDFKYDTLLDKLRGKKSPKFYSYFDVNDHRFPQQAIKGTNKGGNEIFNTKKGEYYSNMAYGGGYANPNNFFKDKEVGEKFQDASDELWAYKNGDYKYQKGKGWVKK